MSSRTASLPAARMPRLGPSLRAYLPGVGVCLAAAAVASAVGRMLPNVSPLIVAIVLGVVVANVRPMPRRLDAGVTFSAKRLLRAGIVFLGLQVVIADIAHLGVPMLAVVVGVVATGLLITVAMGRVLHVPPGLALLIGCGFSICGAAAVAGVSGVTHAKGDPDDETVTAVALVVIFGTVMIPVIPLLAHLIGLSSDTAGLWAGGSIHEIAQVVAAGGVIGGGALTLAVVVKLARVLMLAPVAAVLSIRQRRAAGRARQEGGGPDEEGTVARPPIVPLFVLGFLTMVVLRSSLALPDGVLQAGKATETALLAAAMFALGCGVSVTGLRRVGARPFILAALSTAVMASAALIGVLIAQ